MFESNKVIDILWDQVSDPCEISEQKFQIIVVSHFKLRVFSYCYETLKFAIKRKKRINKRLIKLLLV